MPPQKKQVTQKIGLKAVKIYKRALLLQREMYEFKDVLNDIGLEYEASLIDDGAFEMDLTWNNAD